jgi:hypothetical protein
MWHEVGGAEVPVAAGRGVVLRAAAPPFVAAALLWLVGWSGPAAVVLVVGVVLLVVRLVAPRATAAVDRAVRWAAELVGRVLAGVLLTAFLVLVLVPVGVVRSLLRRELRMPGAAPDLGSSWERRPEGRPPTGRRPFAAEPLPPTTTTRRARTAVPLVAGVAVLLVVADFGAGWAYDEVVGSHDVPVRIASDWPEQLVQNPATADDPWIDDHVAELESLEVEYVPFLQVRTLDHDGETITVADGIRETWLPDDLPGDAPEVWVFGGSAVWGEGQRDAHTLPSELSRLAEGDGVPLRVVNMGERGSTTWQDVLRFEQALAVRPAPAAAIFYGGVNDVQAQLQDPLPGPTYLNVQQEVRSSTRPDLWTRYRQHSVVAGVADWIDDRLGIAAAEAQGVDTTATSSAAPEEARVDEAVADAAFVQREAHLVAGSLADERGVEVTFVWQAHQRGGGSSPYARFRDAAPDALDLTDAADGAGEPVWVDVQHLDEDGTRRVAASIWLALRPRADGWAGPSR